MNILDHLDNYYFDEDGYINVNGDIDLTELNLTNFQGYKFNHISSNFNCAINDLTSLKGAPNYVGGIFNCAFNEITSLEGAPNYVGDNFVCTDNKLKLLEEAPNYVGGNFNCLNNLLVSLDGIPLNLKGFLYSTQFSYKNYIDYKNEMIFKILRKAI